MIYGISDQFAGHGPAYEKHAKCQSPDTVKESAEERRDSLLKDRNFWEFGRPLVRVENGRLQAVSYGIRGIRVARLD